MVTLDPMTAARGHAHRAVWATLAKAIVAWGYEIEKIDELRRVEPGTTKQDLDTLAAGHDIPFNVIRDILLATGQRIAEIKIEPWDGKRC